MVKSVGVLGGALALTVVGALPPARIKSASATAGSEWSGCSNSGYANFDGYKDGTTQRVCVGGSYASSYCGSDGWFRTDGNAYSYYTPIVECGASGGLEEERLALDARQHPYRCADGRFVVYGAGSTFYICSRANP